jgi:hypothetical protein
MGGEPEPHELAGGEPRHWAEARVPDNDPPRAGGGPISADLLSLHVNRVERSPRR